MRSKVGERLIQEIKNRLGFLLEVGLDYLTLDRLTFTLSGGEAQRIKSGRGFKVLLWSAHFLFWTSHPLAFIPGTTTGWSKS